MDPIRLNTREAILLLTLVGIGVGLVLGLVPLIYGKIKGKFRLGLTGFIVSIVAGAIWSILPLFVMITFVFLIIRDQKPKPIDDEDVHQDLTDLPVGDPENQ